MPQSRQLSAIMFTDIVGYTALMGSDEQKAFDLLRKNRAIQKPLIKQYRGTWIKELGDGVLASFPAVSAAVFCAAAMHRACIESQGLQLRIGIHLGEVIFEKNDVFGDGVNIASRLQQLAPIGGTWISEAVYRNITNRKEFTTEFIREEDLKNVSAPVKIYQVELNSAFNDQIALLEKAKRLGRMGSNEYDLAATYAFLGDEQKALHYLREWERIGFNSGTPYYIMIDPLFENFRDNPEFKQIVEREQAKKAAIRKLVNEMEARGEL